MKHPRVNAVKLAQRLKKAVGSAPVSEVAKKANVDVSRVSRFLNGEFKKMTPVLGQLCLSYKIPVEDCLLKAPLVTLSPEILNSLKRIVGNDEKKRFAAMRLIRSLEVLASGNSRPKARKRTK